MMKVCCPTCGKKVEWTNNPYRPFCSKRCKLIDLGKWLNEEYRIGADAHDKIVKHDKRKKN